MEDKIYQSYLEILQEELVPALGCTEPIALAYAAASAREVFGVCPGIWMSSAAGISLRMSKM